MADTVTSTSTVTTPRWVASTLSLSYTSILLKSKELGGATGKWDFTASLKHYSDISVSESRIPISPNWQFDAKKCEEMETTFDFVRVATNEYLTKKIKEAQAASTPINTATTLEEMQVAVPSLGRFLKNYFADEKDAELQEMKNALLATLQLSIEQTVAKKTGVKPPSVAASDKPTAGLNENVQNRLDQIVKENNAAGLVAPIATPAASVSPIAVPKVNAAPSTTPAKKPAPAPAQ